MIREKRVSFLVPQAGESTGYIRVSSGLGQNADGVVYKNEVEFRAIGTSLLSVLATASSDNRRMSGCHAGPRASLDRDDGHAVFHV